MAEADPRKPYALHPFTLRYFDEEMEAAYVQRAPRAMTRGLRPLIILLVPFMLIVGLLEYLHILESPFDWPTAGALAGVLIGLFLMTSVVKKFVEPSLILTFLAFQAILLFHVRTNEDLLSFLSGFFTIILLSHFVGLRFTHGLGTSALLCAVLVGAMIQKQLDLSILVHGCIFLIPGLIVASSAGYTIDRQRRRLFAQIIEMERERATHEKMALHDALTDLPNRNLLRERMEQSFARAKRQDSQFAVLFVDLDDFKTVNDNYGHAIGDRVLRSLADNLLKQVRGEDTVARLGGDEFVILSEQIVDDQGAQIAADRIQTAISKPIVINLPGRGDEIHIGVTCSIGISICPRDGEALDDLISRADEAMYHAKKGGKSTSRFFRQKDRIDVSQTAK